MNKKKILLLVGGAAVIVIVAVVTQYLAMRSVIKKDAGISQPVAEDNKPVVFTANSYSGTIASVSAEKVVIEKEDGGAEEYLINAGIHMYDNRVRDEMKPIKVGDLEKGMQVRVSTTLNTVDDAKVVSLTLYK